MTEPDLRRAYETGWARADRAEKHGWTKNVHTTADNHERHAEGAAAELAVARGLDREWVEDPDAFRSKPDVLPDIEVRRIAKAHWRLPVYRDDHEDWRFVLVYGADGTYDLLGWVKGAVAMAIGSWEDQHATGVGAWFVKQADLNPMGELV